MSARVAADAPGLRALLASGEPAARRRALDALAALPKEQAAALVDAEIAAALLPALASAQRSEQRHAAEVLAPLVADATALLGALRGALAAPDARLRWGVAYTLGRALPAGAELWPAARETLMLDDGDQRWAAAELACNVARGHPAVLDEIRASLRSDSATLRKMSLYCLRDLGVADAPGLARELLGDADAGVRLAALAGVTRSTPGSSDARAAAELLLPMLRTDPDLGVRRAAAATLGKLGVASAAVRDALREAAVSTDASLARAARAAALALEAAG